MNRCASLLAVALFLGSHAAAWSQDKGPPAAKKPPTGVYAVQRDSLKKKDVLPLKDGEVLVVHRHRYLKGGDKEPPRFVVVRSTPQVALDLAGKPQPIKDKTEVVGILLKLQPKAAKALEQLTRDHNGKQVAIILDGEVITIHKVRSVIKGGEVKITSCTPGTAGYLLKRLAASTKSK